MRRTAYILRRLVMFAIVFFGLTGIIFILSYIIPGGAKYLDKPLHEEYLNYMFNVLKGNLGYSWRWRRSISEEILRRLPATFELATVALILAVIIGLPLGIFVANRRNKPSDYIIRAVTLVGVSAPAFWIGLIILSIFYGNWGLFKPGRISTFIEPPPHITGSYLIDSLVTGNITTFIDCAKHIVLPSLVLAFQIVAVICRMTRACMLEVMSQNYIVAARSRGLTERMVIYKHALKNALIPVTTIIGLSYGGLLSGAVLTETIFNWPGLGSYVVDALMSLDTPSVMGSTLIIGIIYALINLVIDIIYSFLDPRITY